MKLTSSLGAFISSLAKPTGHAHEIVAYVFLTPVVGKDEVEVTATDGKILHHCTIEGPHTLQHPVALSRAEMLKLPQKGKGGRLIVEKSEEKLTARVEYDADGKSKLRTTVHLTASDPGTHKGGDLHQKMIEKHAKRDYYPGFGINPSLLAMVAKSAPSGFGNLFIPKDDTHAAVLECEGDDGFNVTSLFMGIKQPDQVVDDVDGTKRTESAPRPKKPFLRRYRTDDEKVDEPQSAVA